MTDVPPTLNAAWKSTCKILLGQEIGELQEYEKFLKRYIVPLKKTKSTFSGKDIAYGAPYSPKAKFISEDEMGLLTPAPLGTNDIKDIDSLFNAVAERFHYAGNKQGGQIKDVVQSEDVSDAFFVYDSRDIFRSENIGYCQMIVEMKYVFGCCWGTKCNFAINTTEFFQSNRLFESTLVTNTADAFYSYNCNNCQEVMFCINQKSTRYAIGNNSLPKDKYLELKKKLLAEISDDLKGKKTVPSHIEVLLGEVKA
jgi:hypothetical protein